MSISGAMSSGEGPDDGQSISFKGDVCQLKGQEAEEATGTECHKTSSTEVANQSLIGSSQSVKHIGGAKTEGQGNSVHRENPTWPSNACSGCCIHSHSNFQEQSCTKAVSAPRSAPSSPKKEHNPTSSNPGGNSEPRPPHPQPPPCKRAHNNNAYYELPVALEACGAAWQNHERFSRNGQVSNICPCPAHNSHLPSSSSSSLSVISPSGSVLAMGPTSKSLSATAGISAATSAGGTHLKTPNNLGSPSAVSVSGSISAGPLLASHDSDSDYGPSVLLPPSTSNNRSRQKKFMKTFSQLPQEEVVLQSDTHAHLIIRSIYKN